MEEFDKKAQSSKVATKPVEKPYFPESKYKSLVENKDVYKNFDEALKAITKTYQMSLAMEIKIKKLYSPMKEEIKEVEEIIIK
jgi:hypothetical protein